MKRARILIGRKKECEIRIPVSSVSREHCEIKVEGGKLKVRDMGSSNGTYVNRERIQEAELSAGQLLGVGPAVFVVVIDGEPAVVDGKDAYARGSAPEPVAAAAAPGARPPKPGSPAPAAKAPLLDDDDLDLRSPDDSSVSDFDFDFLDDEEDKKQPKL